MTVLPVTLGTEDLSKISPHPGVLPLPLLAQYGKGRTRLCLGSRSLGHICQVNPCGTFTPSDQLTLEPLP
jgi:hypothetical protein